jgi:putative GTP pyrophosphokinase
MTTQPKRDPIEVVLREFDGIKDSLDAFLIKTKSLVEASLEDAKIRYQSVQARVKSRKKLQEKYLSPDKSYLTLWDITDLAGLRVITYYEDDIDGTAALIRREFAVDPDNSVDKRIKEPDRFGYSALNFVCAHNEKRLNDVEYKKFAGIKCEIQVTSILKHAWSEIEHEWYDLKEAYPSEIKRDFYRLAAVFELVDSKFADIRKARMRYAKSVTLRVEAMVPNVPIDAVSLKAFADQEAIVKSVDEKVAAAFGGLLDDAPVKDSSLARAARILKAAGLETIQQVRNELEMFQNAVPAYVRKCTEGGLWTVRPGAPFERILGLIHFGLFLICLKGVKALSDYYSATAGSLPGWDLNAQVQNALTASKENLK